MVPILITRFRTNKDPKILERHKELISRDRGVSINNGANILVLGRVRGKEELCFVSVKEERGYFIYDIKTLQENLPAQSDIDDGNSKIITVGQDRMPQRGKEKQK